MPLMDVCIQRFLEHMERLIKEQGPEHVILHLARIAMQDVNGSNSFGISLDVYSAKKNIFFECADAFFTASTTLSLRRFVEILFPGFQRFLHKWFGVQGPVEYLNGFFMKLIKDIVKETKGKPFQKCNLMNMLIGLKEDDDVKKNNEGIVVIDDSLIAAQAMSFYLAGFEPTSLFLTFLLFELALQPKIQQRVYEEANEIIEKHNGALTYDSLMDMKYMMMVTEEMMRKYSASLNRKCMETCTLSNGSITIEKGKSQSES